MERADEVSFTGEVAATDVMQPLLKSYVRYSNREFMPSNVDGLTLLYRRILMVLKDAKTNMKCTTLIGDVMKVHPHGDSSVEGGIKTLGQPFSQVLPWLTIKGNFGAYGGAQPGAARYLDIAPNGFAKDIFFEDTDLRVLTYVPSEMGEGVEPLYLVPKIPTAFLTGINAMPSGYATNVPMLNFINVCNMVEKYIELRKKNPTTRHKMHDEIAEYCVPDYDSIARFCVPDYPSHSLVRNQKELVASYSKGDYSKAIITDGLMEVGPTEIRLRSLPYGKVTFESVILKLGSMLNSANVISANCTEISDLTTGVEYGNLVIKLKRTTNPFDILDDIKRLCSFTQKNHPLWKFVDKDDCTTEMNPMELLELWYTARYRAILAGLKFVNNDLFRQLRKLAALIIIADHTDDVIAIFRNAENRQATVPILCREYGLTADQAEYISSLELHQITRQGKEDLLRAHAEIKTKISEFQKKFSRIDEIILEQVGKLKEKYNKACKRRTELPSFIGAVQLLNHNGVIQFSSLQELCTILKRWAKATPYQVIFYPKGAIHRMYRLGSNFITDDEMDLPKEFKANDMYVFKGHPKYTILIKDHEISKNNGLTYLKEKSGICAYVGDNFTAVTDDFKLIQCSTSDVRKRNTADAKGFKTDINYVDGLFADDVVVAFANVKNANVVDFARLKPGQKYRAELFGKTHVLGMWKYGDVISLLIPEKYINHCTTNSVIIRDVQTFFDNQDVIRLFVNRRKTSTGQSLHPMFKGVDTLTDLPIGGKDEQ